MLKKATGRAAFDQYYLLIDDDRALKMVNYFRYGTVDETEIWLMKYGLSIEDAEQIKEYISEISADEIIFNDGFSNLDDDRLKAVVERYV